MEKVSNKLTEFCENCGKAIVQKKSKGRAKKYCDSHCRINAFWKRKFQTAKEVK